MIICRSFLDREPCRLGAFMTSQHVGMFCGLTPCHCKPGNGVSPLISLCLVSESGRLRLHELQGQGGGQPTTTRNTAGVGGQIDVLTPERRRGPSPRLRAWALLLVHHEARMTIHDNITNINKKATHPKRNHIKMKSIYL